MNNFNPNIKLNKKDFPEVESLYKKIEQGDRYALSKAITMIESEKTDHKLKSKELINICVKAKKDSFRIGITGAPGVGKSTLLESLGMYIIEQNQKPAVLAIDPSSKLTGGSILGDKTRMNNLSFSEKAFIRPSPAGSTLGGVTKKTRETIILTETAGYKPIFVETVGVGQSEIAAHSMTDLFILLIHPGAGDEIQGIKRGIMEMADIVVINKADGENIINAQNTYNQYSNALKLLSNKENGWTTKIIMVSALDNVGMKELWNTILEYETFIKKTDYFYQNRSKQNLSWFDDYLFKNLISVFQKTPELNIKYIELKNKVTVGNLSPYQAGDILLKLLMDNLK